MLPRLLLSSIGLAACVAAVSNRSPPAAAAAAAAQPTTTTTRMPPTSEVGPGPTSNRTRPTRREPVPKPEDILAMQQAIEEMDAAEEKEGDGGGKNGKMGAASGKGKGQTPRLMARGPRDGNGAGEQIEVQVVMQVVSASEEGAADVTDERINSQIDILNTAFRPGNISFRLNETTRTVNAAMLSDHESLNQLHKGDKSTLNIFILDEVRTDGDPVAGYAYPPVYLNKSPKQDIVVISALNTAGAPRWLADGENEYALGMTAVHEVGHWFGLLHTFDGGCDDARDDMVEDTPREKEATYECRPVDTCPKQPGMDSIHNYMSYTPDSCMNEFTPGQLARLQRLWRFFRAPAPSSKLDGCRVAMTLLAPPVLTQDFAVRA